ncbi:MAG: hypothetical protein ACYDAO_07885 [Thermoplasmataceae archaeon]
MIISGYLWISILLSIPAISSGVYLLKHFKAASIIASLVTVFLSAKVFLLPSGVYSYFYLNGINRYILILLPQYTYFPSYTPLVITESRENQRIYDCICQ